MKPVDKKQQEAENPGVIVDDHIYFQHPDGPQAAKVVATGRHGVTVHHAGKHHKVKWQHFLGHKTRAQQAYDVLDEGEDGLIVKDKTGQRRYLNIPPESKKDSMMLEKSLGGGSRLVIFAKGGPLANRPGLAKKQITDKSGHQTTRWVKTTPDAEPAQKGHHVGFQNGEHQGHGQVLTSGQHGVTVQDRAGGQHRVPHDKVSHRWEGEGEPDTSPHEQDQEDGQGEQSAESIARALFDTSEVDKLPAKAYQPVKSWEELSAKANEGLAEFKGILGKVATSLDLEQGKRPQSFDNAQEGENEKAKAEKREPKQLNADEFMLPEHWDSDKGFLFMGPLKGKDRASEKVRTDYDGDWSQVRDMVRATIAVPMVTQIPKVLAELKANGIELAQKPKNNLVKPLPGGYRDINLIVKLPNGLLAELQVHIKPMTLAKEKGHKPYETTRAIEGKYREKGVQDKEQWDPEDRKTHESAMRDQEKLYGDAWDRASGTSSNLTKSLEKPIIILWSRGVQNG